MHILIALVVIAAGLFVGYYFMIASRFQCPRCRNIGFQHDFFISERVHPLSLGPGHHRDIKVQRMKCKQCLYSWEMSYKISLRSGTPRYRCDGCGGLHDNYIRMSTSCWWDAEGDQGKEA